MAFAINATKQERPKPHNPPLALPKPIMGSQIRSEAHAATTTILDAGQLDRSINMIKIPPHVIAAYPEGAFDPELPPVSGCYEDLYSAHCGSSVATAFGALRRKALLS